ncbi:hypothetical protein VaNZ11_014169 [Volvox africanus]|uniref:BTB domain-containing protein n=1 Tax=Volvox africanus TaxID=51714 RepID=A0ABQ5SHT9_9CHLO|nr:hypothetical protein VaNZ11_014169 [Volvox africanus]
MQPLHDSEPGHPVCPDRNTIGTSPPSDSCATYCSHQQPQHPGTSTCSSQLLAAAAGTSAGNFQIASAADVMDTELADAETVAGVSIMAVAGDVDGASSCAAGHAREAEEEVGEVEDLPAHRVVLAASCDYFRALLIGAGTAMNDMATAVAAGAAAAAAAAAEGATTAPPSAAPAVAVVSLPGLDGWALRLAVGALYERRVEVAVDTLEGLLSAASYLGATALLDACATFMRSTLGLQNCLPLLLLAWRYNLVPLRDELMAYVCRRFSVLVRTYPSPDGPRSSTESGSGADLRLMSLPLDLLVEVLHNEELLVECESDVLQCVLEWLAEQEPMDGPTASGCNNSGCNYRYPAIMGGSNAGGNDARAAAARELARLVHWGALPDPPHLQLARREQVRALAALLEAHAGEAAAQAAPHVTAGGSEVSVGSGEARVPPAMLRLRRLLMDLQGMAAHDLAPCGVVEAATQRPQRGGPVAAASGADGIGGGCGEASKRIGPVVMADSGSGSGSDSRRGFGAGGTDGGRRRSHLTSYLLAAGGHDASWRSVKAVEMYDPRTDQWIAGPSLLQGLSFTGSALVPRSGSGFRFEHEPGGSGIKSSCGAVYLVGGTPLCSSVWRLPWGSNGPVGQGWEPCPPLLMPRAHAGVVSIAGTLTVLGGRSQVQQVQRVLNTVEMLIPSASVDVGAAGSAAFLPPSGASCWRFGPDMVLPRSAHACAVLGGRIFALGGSGGGSGGGGGGGSGSGGSRGPAAGGSGSTHRSGEFLDLDSGRWQLLGCDMATERKYTAAAAHGGRIYVAGGVKDSRTRLSSLEALDPRERKWATLEPMSAPRSSHSMAALGDCLYIAGGQCSSVDLMVGGGRAGASPANAAGAATSIGIDSGGTAWGLGTSGFPMAPSPPFFASNLGLLGTSPPALSHARSSIEGAGLCRSAPGPGSGWAAAGLGLGPGLGIPAGVTAAVASGSFGAGAGVGGEDVTVLSQLECYDVAAGRWRQCAPLAYGGRAGLALCAV